MGERIVEGTIGWSPALLPQVGAKTLHPGARGGMGLMKNEKRVLLPAALSVTSFHTLKALVDPSSPARNLWPFYNV